MEGDGDGVYDGIGAIGALLRRTEGTGAGIARFNGNGRESRKDRHQTLQPGSDGIHMVTDGIGMMNGTSFMQLTAVTGRVYWNLQSIGCGVGGTRPATDS